MDPKVKEAYRQLIQPRYQRANRSVKKRVLDEFCLVCGYHRKYAITLLKQPMRIKKTLLQKRGPKPCYHEEVFVKALQRIWYGVDLICAKRLKVAIPLWLPHYDQHYESLSEEVRRKLLTISAASIDRVLKPIRDTLEIKKRCQTKPGTLLKHRIPLRKK